MCVIFVLMVLLVNICSSQSDYNGNNMGNEVQGVLIAEIFVSIKDWLNDALVGSKMSGYGKPITHFLLE